MKLEPAQTIERHHLNGGFISSFCGLLLKQPALHQKQPIKQSKYLNSFFAVRALKTANKPSSFPCNTATNALSKERFRP